MVAVEKKPPVPEPVPSAAEPRPWRVTLEQYQHLAELGAFGEAKVELANGAIYEMSPTGPQHEHTLMLLDELLKRALGQRAYVRVQMSLVAGSSQPEPDIAVVERRSYAQEVPKTAFLVVEVADSSLAYDRGPKAAMYAQAAVPEYWVVDVRNRWIEVHDTLVDGQYTRVTPYKPGETLRTLAFADVAIAVTDIFA
jgi:Uma2 family endonuclease